MGIELMLNRSIKILEYNKLRSHTVMETSTALGIPIASTHRIFKVLKSTGWLMKDKRIWNEEQTKKATAYLSTVSIQKIR